MAVVGDIVLDDKSYRIDVMSYRGRDIIDFAPRATVPGGSVIMSDLGLYQPLVQSDWRHGFGFHWYSDAQGYLSTTGYIDTRQSGLVMLMTKATVSDTDANIKYGFTVWNNAVWAWGDGGLHKYSGGSWTKPYASGKVNFAIAAGDYLFYCPDGARIRKVNTSDVHSDAGLDANATDYKWLVIHNGYIYAGKDGTNRVHYSNATDLSTLEGTTSDTKAIYCGIGNKATIGAIVYAGQLYVSRPDGLWHISEDNISRNILDYSSVESSQNFRGMAIVNGFLMFPIRNRMIQWNGARVADFTPDKVTDTFPYTTYGRFDNLVSSDNFLYCIGRTNVSSYGEDLLCYDGVGWHKLIDLLKEESTQEVYAMAYDPINNYMWVHLKRGFTNETYYIPFQSNSSFPYASFTTSGENSVTTSRMDMGFRRVKKSLTSLWLETANLTSTRTIAVYYSLDGGSWTLWNTITTNGVVELEFPAREKTVEFNWIQLKFVLATADAAQSPILEGYTLRFIMRPETTWGYSFNVIASGEFESDQRQDERTSSEIIADLRELRRSSEPIRMVDLLGNELWGYITSVTEQPTYRNTADEDEGENLEYWVACNFVEI